MSAVARKLPEAPLPPKEPPPRDPVEPRTTTAERVKLFFTFFDARFEDLDKKTWKKTVYRDFSAGLVVALTAIPMAMGFAMAMGLRPEQGIIAGALACAIGRTFGGSKYQVYGPTAAFIPLIASLISKYQQNGGTFAQAHGMLVFVSILAGIVLMLGGVLGLGRFAKKVPPSIIVGFTIGIACAIALSNATEALGLPASSGSIRSKIALIATSSEQYNWWALGLAVLTFLLTRGLLRISIFIPAPLVALGVCTVLSATVLDGEGVSVIKDRYGSIPTNFFVFTPPILPAASVGVALDVVYYVIAIVFVSGIESVLCSTMADRLAKDGTRPAKSTPFNADKELWGQGLVQILTPLVNGFPCTGALARTATAIKAGAVTPLAGYFKFALKLAMAYFLASQLERVPLACIAGILLWVASNMVKKAEIVEIWRKAGKFHVALMIYTAVMVPMTDFLTAVLSSLAIYAVFGRFFKKPEETPEKKEEPRSDESGTLSEAE